MYIPKFQDAPAYYPSYVIGDQSVFVTPRQVGGYESAPVKVIGSGSIASENFLSGSTGWIIRGDGSFELSDGIIRGDLYSSNYVFNTSGWFLDYDTGSAEFNGTVIARDLATGQSGDVRVYLTDSGVVGGTSAGIYFDTGDSDQQDGATIFGTVVNTGAANEFHRLSILGYDAYLQSHYPARILLDTEASNGSGGQRLWALVDANNGLEGGFMLADETGPDNGSIYYGYEYLATQTYMLLSTRVDFWNWEWVRVNTGTDLIVDDNIHTSRLYLESTGSGNDWIGFNDTTNIFELASDGVAGAGELWGSIAYFDQYYFGADGSNDYIDFNDTTNVFSFFSDGGYGDLVAGDFEGTYAYFLRYYIGTSASNDYLTIDDTDDDLDMYSDGTLLWSLGERGGSYVGLDSSVSSHELALIGTTTVRLFDGATMVARFDVDSGNHRLISGNAAGFYFAGTDDWFFPGIYSSVTAASDARIDSANGRLYYQTSSGLLKQNLRKPDVFDMGDIMKIEPTIFDEDPTMSDTNGTDILGFIAEELAEIDPRWAVWAPSHHLPGVKNGNRRLVEDEAGEITRIEFIDPTPKPVGIDTYAVVSTLVKHVQALTLEVENLKRLNGQPVLRDLG